jgi:hypothetical protein
MCSVKVAGGQDGINRGLYSAPAATAVADPLAPVAELVDAQG